MHTKEKNVSFLNAIEISLSPTSREGPFHVMFVRTPMHLESQDATKIFSALPDSSIYLFTKMMTLYITIFLSVSSSVSPSVVTMPTSRPTGICRVNNLYQEPILEDYYCKEEQCDSELEGEDDGWLGTENHWCPLWDLSYHAFIGRSRLGFMEEMDLASLSATCQLAIFIATVERETATKHVWWDRIYRSWLDEWCYVPPCPTLQRQWRNEVLKWKISQQWRVPWLRKT